MGRGGRAVRRRRHARDRLPRRLYRPRAGARVSPQQFRLGYYRYDDRLRGRRFPLVDEERGLVLAGGFIDHCGRLGDYILTDAAALSSPIRRPHTFCLMELFKISDGAIEQIEANFITVPYHMPSPWDG